MTHVASVRGWINSDKIPPGAIECCGLCMGYVRTGEAPPPDLKFMQLWHADHTANPRMYGDWVLYLDKAPDPERDIPDAWLS